MAELSSSKPAAALPGYAPRGEEDEVIQRRTFRDYYIILRERMWIALPLAILVSVSIGYYQARSTPMYRATATMQFEKPETIVTTQGVIDPSVRSDADLNTYLQELNTSNRLRARVIESLTPDEQRILVRPAMKHLAPGQPLPSASSWLGNISADPVGKSYIISITVTHQDPDAAALIANRYVLEFMQQLFESVGGADESAVNYLKMRAQDLQKESVAADLRLQQYMQEHNFGISLEKTHDLISERLQSVSSALDQANLDLLKLENLYQQVQDYRAQGRDLLDISYIAEHQGVGALRDQLVHLVQQQDDLSERYLERHPKMIEVASEIAVARDQLNKAIQQACDDLATTLANQRDEVAALQKDYAERNRDALNLHAMSSEYDLLQQAAEVAKNNYSAIMDRLSQTQTTKNLEKIPLHPLDDAIAPSAPYSPDIHRIVRTCGGLFLVTFIGVAVGLSFIDDRIKSAWDVEAFIGATLLGIIPELGSNNKGDERHTLILENKQAPGVEAFLSIYSSIKIHSKLDFPKSVLITSTIPGEGKTLISSNLASCFARHGKRTLLVDCDLRRPMLHRHFKQQNVVGLITWFENGANLDEDLETSPQLGITKISENLWLLSSGGRSKSPTEILESPVFGQLLEKLKKRFDLVMVDSPPMGAVTDSLLIAERTDEVVYVCRFNRAYRKHIKLYIRALLNGKNSILGIVLNGLSPRRIEYYSNYRYYRSYKKYYGAQT